MPCLIPFSSDVSFQLLFKKMFPKEQAQIFSVACDFEPFILFENHGTKML
jgi:hypothetical protein